MPKSGLANAQILDEGQRNVFGYKKSPQSAEIANGPHVSQWSSLLIDKF